MTKQQIIDKFGMEEYLRRRAAASAYMKRYYQAQTPGAAAYRERVQTARKTPEANRAATARWRANHPEQKRAESREYMKAKYDAMSPEERKAWARERYLAKRAKMAVDPDYDAQQRAQDKARHDAWRAANREHVREARFRWEAENPELVKAIAVAAAQNRRFKVNVWSRNNKERRRQAGAIDGKLVLMLKSQPCIDCGSNENIEVGHAVPVKLGGTNDPANLIPQCRSCNRRLSARPHRTAARNGQKD